MDDERARILRMVAEGKISPEEAADLLEAIGPAASSDRGRAAAGVEAPAMPSPPYPAHPRRRSRALVIHIKEGGENKVNVRIPLGLTKVAGKFIPRQAAAYLGKYDINLQEFLDEVGEAEGGTLLEVREGENKVLIAVE